MKTLSVTPSPVVGAAQLHPCTCGICASCTAEGRGEGAFRKFWNALRTLSGDDAYEQYCAHFRAHHPDQTPLDRRAFYVQSQTKKWGGINRCC